MSFQNSQSGLWKYSGSACCISTLLMPDLPFTRLLFNASLVLSLSSLESEPWSELLSISSSLYFLLANWLLALSGPLKNAAEGVNCGLLNNRESVEEACQSEFFSKMLVKPFRKQLLQASLETGWAHHSAAPKPGPNVPGIICRSIRIKDLLMQSLQMWGNWNITARISANKYSTPKITVLSQPLIQILWNIAVTSFVLGRKKDCMQSWKNLVMCRWENVTAVTF